MAILTGPEIIKEVHRGFIKIDNFDPNKINPNSYNLTLNEKLLVYKETILDCKADNQTEELIIPETGLLLMPGTLYLARTNERTVTKGFVPMLEGRSSIGRLGILVHVTAGFGDVGFDGFWTLEIACIQPVKIYPNMEICQIYYETKKGEIIEYKGKYQNNSDVQASKLYLDFK